MNLRLCDWEKYKITVTKSDKNRTPIDPSNAEPDNKDYKEQVVLDLHVGKSVIRSPNGRLEQFGKELEIRPHECLSVETEEMVITPNNVFGVVCCRHSISARGIWVANAKIDPVFGAQPRNGNALLITVMNTTDRKATLKLGEAFCSIYFSELTGPVSDEPRFPLETPQLEKNWWEKLLYKLEPHTASIILAIATIFASIVGAYFTVLFTNTKSPTQPQSTPQNAILPQAVTPTQPLPTPTNATPKTP